MEHDSSKGLETKTVAVLRDRLEKSYRQNSPHFTCFYHTELKVGWIINEGNIFIYNNDNVYYELKLAPKLDNIKASQVIIINNENGAFLLLVDDRTIYSRKINEEYDLRYTQSELKLLTQDEHISVVHLLNSPISNVPCLIIATTNGRLLNCQMYVDEDSLNVEELVVEAPKRLYTSLTSFFTGGNIEETNFHSIHSDASNRNSAYLFAFGERSLNVWTLTTNGTELWRVNIENIFRKNDQSAGDICWFKIIGEEVIEGTKPENKILILVIQIVSRKNGQSNSYQALYYELRLTIDIHAQNTEAYTPTQLSSAKPYTQQEDEVKCLVCSNDGTMTYIFLCYEHSTSCFSIFSDHYDEDVVDVRVMGHGIMFEKVRNFLLFVDREIMMFSLLREHSFKGLMKYYLKEVEEGNRQRKKIREANLESVATRMEGDDEKKVLDMIRSLQDVHGDIHGYKTDLLAMMRSRGDESFQQILMNVTQMLIDDPIRDSMVCYNQREEIKSEDRLDYITDNPAMIDWSLNTKLSRVKVINNFLNGAGIDFLESIRSVEEKLIFFQAIKKKHDELCKIHNNYQSLTLFNQTIQDIVKNVHKITKQEIKQKGTTSSLVFYSFPLKGADHFIHTLSKLMYEKKFSESISEDTVLQLSSLIMESLKAVQTHRKTNYSDESFLPTSLMWTMDPNGILDPIKRVIELMPELIRLNESVDLNERMYELSRVVLKELEFAKNIELERNSEEDMLQRFMFTRDKLVNMVKEFSVELAIELAIEFQDVVNTTRLCVLAEDYHPLYKLLNSLKGEEHVRAIHESMQWLVKDYLERLKKRRPNEPMTFKLQLMDIFENKYDAELLEFLEKYPKLRLIFYMRKGQFNEICSECDHLSPSLEDPTVKPLLESIKKVNFREEVSP